MTLPQLLLKAVIVILLSGCNLTKGANHQKLIYGDENLTKEIIGCKPKSPSFLAFKNSRTVSLYGSVHAGTKEIAEIVARKADTNWLDIKYLYTETGLPIGLQQPSYIEKNKNLKRATEILSASSEQLEKWQSFHGDQFNQWSVADMMLSILANAVDLKSVLDDSHPTRQDVSPLYGVEHVLMNVAYPRGIEVMPLELAEIAQVIEEIPESDVAAYASSIWSGYEKSMRGTLNKDDLPDGLIKVSELVSLWQSGRIDALANLTNAQEEYFLRGLAKPLGKIIQMQRNIKMAEKIDTEIANADYTPLVVVGMYHLAGKNGLLSLLKDRGYTITCQ
jgi:uncharacterized protein YbaP (TraB family)